MFLLLGAFVAGVLTVLAPCVLPLLPVIIGGSVSGDAKDKRRPLLVAGSLAVSLVVFTLLLKATSLLINVPPQAITYASGGLIIAIGLATLFPKSCAILMAKLGIEQRAQRLLGTGNSKRGKWLGPVLTGAALGPVFSSCSPVYGYILATILPANFTAAITYIVSYVAGLSLTLLAVGYYGQRLTGRLKFASDPRGYFQRGLAALFIAVGVLIITGTGTKIQVWAAGHTPFNFDGFSAKLIPKQSNQAVGSAAGDNSGLYNVPAGVKAPELAGIQAWVNSQPLTLASLKGKVVLIDFWTYTCINCIRTLPYVQGWYQHYKNDGLVVIGVEAPEFAYEKVPVNVQAAVKQDGLTYPIAIDGDLATWNAYQNQYWPAEYLIDRDGNVRRAHFGEGEYDQTEQAIRGLLAQDSQVQPASGLVAPQTTPSPVSQGQTPETYLGLERAQAYAGTPDLGSQPDQNYHFADHLQPSQWSLSGEWQVSPTSVVAGNDAKLRINVAAKNVYLVGGAGQPAKVEVSFNGQPINRVGGGGVDVSGNYVTIHMSNLYRIASFKTFSSGIIELNVPPGVSLNAFTFGN